MSRGSITQTSLEMLQRDLDNSKKHKDIKGLINVLRYELVSAPSLEILMEIGPPTVLKEEAINLLREIGDPSVQQLIKSLKNTLVNLAIKMPRYSGSSLDQRIQYLFQEFSISEDIWLLRAIVAFGNAAIDRLIHNFRGYKVVSVMASLGFLFPKDEVVLETLLNTLQDQDKYRKRGAVRGLVLSGVKDEKVIEYLQSFAKNRSVEKSGYSSWFPFWFPSSLAKAIIPARVAAIAVLTEWSGARTAPMLLDLLNDNTEPSQIRTEAIVGLGTIKCREAVELLMGIVNGTNHSKEMRQKAVWALGKINDARAIDTLIGALADKDPTVRENAAVALGEIREPRAVEPLYVAWADAKVRSATYEAWVDAKVRSAAAESLWKLKLQNDPATERVLLDVGKRFVASLTEELRRTAQGVARPLGHVKPDSVGLEARKLLAQGAALGKAGTAQLLAIGASGKPGIEHMMHAFHLEGGYPAMLVFSTFGYLYADQTEMLDHLVTMWGYGLTDKWAKLGVAYGLSWARSKNESLVNTWVDIIETAIKAGIDMYLETAERLLERIGIDAGEPWSERCLGLLDDTHSWNRSVAAIALGMMKYQPAVERLLMHALEDQEYRVRVDAGRALGAIGDSRAVDPLACLLADLDRGDSVTKDPEAPASVEAIIHAFKVLSIGNLRDFTGFSLARLSDRRATENLLQQLEPQTKKIYTSTTIWSRAYRDPTMEMAIQLIYLIGHLRDPAAIAPLVKLLDHVSIPIRVACTEVLAIIGTEEVVEPLIIRACLDKAPKVKAAAIKALADIRDVRAIKALEYLLADRDELVHTAASEALETYRKFKSTFAASIDSRVTAPVLDSAEKDYVRKCLEPHFREEREDREFWRDPEAQRVLGPLNASRNEEAAREAETMAARYSRLDACYRWGGTANLELGAYDRARSLLRQGLDKAKRKNSICTVFGEVEWKARNTRDALYWWAQAIHCQESIKNYSDESPYLYLYYVAEGLELSDVAAAFIARVDRIRLGQVRLNPSIAADLRNLVRNQKTPGMSSTTAALYRESVVNSKGYNNPPKSENACNFNGLLKKVLL